MIWIIIFGLIVIITLLVFIKKYIVKKYLIHQYNSGVGLQYRDFTKEYYQFNNSKSIDEETFIDLEMPQILERINYTYTQIGNEYLYNLFFKEKNNFFIQEAIIKKLTDQKKLAEIIYQLNNLNKEYVPILSITKSLEKFSFKYYLIVIIVLIMDIASIIATIINFNNFYFIIIMFLFSLLLNTQLTQKIGPINLQVSFINDLARVSNKLLKINIYPNTNQNMLSTALKEIKKITKLTYYFNIVKQIDIFGIFELLKSVFFIDILQTTKLAKMSEQVKHDIFILYENIGILDTCITVKINRSISDICIPEIIKEKKIAIIEGYHMLIDKPVKNTIVLKNNMIITGSNASGKSTFLKMIGANLLLAKSLNISFAKEFKYYPFSLISSIHMKDDIISGDSFYVKEIKRLKYITNHVYNQESLILIDEILKGTNEKERIVIARAILKYLFESNSMVIVTTHDIELANDFNRIDKYCFNDLKKDNNIIFDYLIRSGICTVGNAIAIIKSLNFNQSIIKEIEI
ncbi:MutS-related protein [Thomasclavelia sp.]